MAVEATFIIDHTEIAESLLDNDSVFGFVGSNVVMLNLDENAYQESVQQHFQNPSSTWVETLPNDFQGSFTMDIFSCNLNQFLSLAQNTTLEFLSSMKISSVKLEWKTKDEFLNCIKNAVLKGFVMCVM
jgi:hypothetical protein